MRFAGDDSALILGLSTDCAVCQISNAWHTATPALSIDRCCRHHEHSADTAPSALPCPAHYGTRFSRAVKAAGFSASPVAMSRRSALASGLPRPAAAAAQQAS